MESDKIECEWCSKTFVKKANLAKHQKNTKSCIAMQKINPKEQCKYCKAHFFVSKIREHICTDKYQILERDLSVCKNECEELSNKLIYVTGKLELANDKIRDLELKLSESKGYIKGVEKNKFNNNINSNNTNNTYIKITNIITEHMKPFDKIIVWRIVRAMFEHQ